MSLSGVCVLIDSNGYLITSDTAVESCDSFILTSAAEYNFIFEPVIDPVQISYVFGWGFGAVILGFSLGFALKAAVKTIDLI